MKQEIILTGSCYWCLEAVFQRLKGIELVESGFYHISDYAFSLSKNDKIEAIRIVYETDVLPLPILFNLFYLTHNPTLITWDKNSFYPGCRSAVFYHTDEQKLAIETKIDELIKTQFYEGEIQTKVAKIIPHNFFIAEKKYQNYYNSNPKDGYCTSIIDPKLERFRNEFKEFYINK